MNKESFIKKLGVLIFIAFSGLYFVLSTGYYAKEEKKKMVMTNEEIKKFEEDVKSGKPVDEYDYLKYDYVDYSNKMSKNMTKLSNGIESGFEKAIKFLFKEASNMIEK